MKGVRRETLRVGEARRGVCQSETRSQPGRQAEEGRTGLTDRVFFNKSPPTVEPFWRISTEAALILEDSSRVGRALPLELGPEGGRMGVNELQNWVSLAGRRTNVARGRHREGGLGAWQSSEELRRELERAGRRRGGRGEVDQLWIEERLYARRRRARVPDQEQEEYDQAERKEDRLPGGHCRLQKTGTIGSALAREQEGGAQQSILDRTPVSSQPTLSPSDPSANDNSREDVGLLRPALASGCPRRHSPLARSQTQVKHASLSSFSSSSRFAAADTWVGQALDVPSIFFVLPIPWRLLLPHVPLLNPLRRTDWTTRFARFVPPLCSVSISCVEGVKADLLGGVGWTGYKELRSSVVKTTHLTNGTSTLWLADKRAVKLVSIDRKCVPHFLSFSPASLPASIPRPLLLLLTPLSLPTSRRLGALRLRAFGSDH